MSDNTPVLPQPRSLGPHTIPEDRATLIRKHIAMLSDTALVVAEGVPFAADSSDLVRILESEPEEA